MWESQNKISESALSEFFQDLTILYCVLLLYHAKASLFPVCKVDLSTFLKIPGWILEVSFLASTTTIGNMLIYTYLGELLMVSQEHHLKAKWVFDQPVMLTLMTCHTTDSLLHSKYCVNVCQQYCLTYGYQIKTLKLHLK